MQINDKVTYTPDVITVTQGEPVEGVIKSISHDWSEYTIVLPDGTEKRVEASKCQP